MCGKLLSLWELFYELDGFYPPWPKQGRGFKKMKMLLVTKSEGRTKSGETMYFVRPAGKCRNRSWRVKARNVSEFCQNKFPKVLYFDVDGIVIGAANEDNAVKEYYRICEKSKIGKPVLVKTIENGKN